MQTLPEQGGNKNQKPQNLQVTLTERRRREQAQSCVTTLPELNKGYRGLRKKKKGLEKFACRVLKGRKVGNMQQNAKGKS